MEAQTLVEFAITVVAASGFAAWVLRTLITRFLELQTNKALEQYKIAHEKELAEFKAALQQLVDQRQLVFARLHEKRAQVIADLFEAAVGLETVIERISTAGELEQESATDLGSAGIKFKVLLQKSRIYLSESTTEILNTYLLTLYAYAVGVDKSGSLFRTLGGKDPPSVELGSKNLCDALLVQGKRSNDQLIQEFRILLGVDPGQLPMPVHQSEIG